MKNLLATMVIATMLPLSIVAQEETPKATSADTAILKTCLGKSNEGAPYPSNETRCLWESFRGCTKTNGDSSVQEHTCLMREYAVWDAQLNANYRAKLSWFDSMLKDSQVTGMERDIYQTGQKALREAQRAWMSYRDKACDAVAGEYGMGNGVTNAIRICLTELTAQRAQMIKTQ